MKSQSEYARDWYIRNRDRILRKQHEARRKNGGQPRRRFHWSDRQIQNIVYRLLYTDATTRKIANEYQCSKSTIDKIFRANTTKSQRLAVKAKKQADKIRGRKLNRPKKSRDPQAIAARAAVNNAVARGKLVRPSVCTQPGCKNSGRIEAHHWHGYDNEHALDVVWLCPKCHRFADNSPDVWVISFEVVQ